MNSIRLRNQKAEDAYFRMLKRWREALIRINEHDEKTLKWLWNCLEREYRAVGYEFGDREGIK